MDADKLDGKVVATLKPEKTAIVVVDVMDGYCRPDAPLGQYLTKWEDADYADLDRAADTIIEFLQASRKLPIAATVFVRMEERPSSQPESIRLKMEVTEQPEITVKDGQGWGYYKVRPAVGDHQMIKYHHDAFLNTSLDDYLKKRAVTTVIVVGGHASTCVDSTARTAAQLGYHTFVPADMTADVSPPGSTHTPDDVRGKLYVINNVMGYMPLSTEILRIWGV